MRRRDRVAIVVLAWLGRVLDWFAGRRMWRGTEPGERAMIAARQLTEAPGSVMRAVIERVYAEHVDGTELEFHRERLNQWIEPDA